MYIHVALVAFPTLAACFAVAVLCIQGHIHYLELGSVYKQSREYRAGENALRNEGKNELVAKRLVKYG